MTRRRPVASGYFRTIPAVLLSFLAVLAGPTAALPAFAQASNGIVVKQRFGYWTHVCEPPPPGAKAQICVIEQILKKTEEDRFNLNIQLKKTPSGKWAMRIIAPHFVMLPAGVGLYIDGKYIGSAPYFRCVLRRPRCLAQVEIDSEVQAKLTSGKVAVFRIFLTQEKGTDFEVSLSGLAQGMAALK